MAQFCLCNRYTVSWSLLTGQSSRQREADNVTAGCSVLTDLLVLTHTVYELELGRKAEDRTWSSLPTSPHTTTTTTQQSVFFVLFTCSATSTKITFTFIHWIFLGTQYCVMSGVCNGFYFPSKSIFIQVLFDILNPPDLLYIIKKKAWPGQIVL